MHRASPWPPFQNKSSQSTNVTYLHISSHMPIALYVSLSLGSNLGGRLSFLEQGSCSFICAFVPKKEERCLLKVDQLEKAPLKKKKKSLIPIWRISKRCPCGRAHGFTEESTFVGWKKMHPWLPANAALSQGSGLASATWLWQQPPLTSWTRRLCSSAQEHNYEWQPCIWH